MAQTGRLQVGKQKGQATEGSAKLQIKEYKESLVLQAAATLFYERGFDRTTLDDIAASLGVTKPFIYTYFESKHNLLERLVDRVFHDFYQTVIEFRKLPEKDPILRFEFFIRTYVRSNLEMRQFTALVLQEEKNLNASKRAEMDKKHHEFDRLLAGLISDGVKAGVFRVDDAALTSLAISGMVRWTHRWYLPEGRLSADEICAQLTDTALRMVGYEPAFAPAEKTPQAVRRPRKAAVA
jgi:AcrR family transcriptional regulator